MDQSLLKSCLNHSFYEENKAKLRASLFDETMKDVFETIVSMHDKFEKDITPLELFTYWKSKNPTSTGAWSAEIEDLVNSISNADDIDSSIATEVIETLWRQHIGLDIAQLGIAMSEGDATAMDRLVTLLDRVSGSYLPDDFDDRINTQDIYELLAETSNENRFKFNIETLSRNVYGIGRGEFGVIAAYSNVGKSALAISLCTAPEGFCHQGAKVGYIINEEKSGKHKLRAMQAFTGMSREEIDFDPQGVAARYKAISDKLMFVDGQTMDIQQLDGFLNKHKFDVVIVDMADKVLLTQIFNSGHERLRELYYRLRELAKKHDVALIGLSQASAEAEGRTRLTPTMLEGSKVGKVAETDILLGVGRMIDQENPDDPSRWITVMKNKISGWHGTVMCQLNQKTSRYEV